MNITFIRHFVLFHERDELVRVRRAAVGQVVAGYFVEAVSAQHIHERRYVSAPHLALVGLHPFSRCCSRVDSRNVHEHASAMRRNGELVGRFKHGS